MALIGEAAIECDLSDGPIRRAQRVLRVLARSARTYSPTLVPMQRRNVVAR